MTIGGHTSIDGSLYVGGSIQTGSDYGWNGTVSVNGVTLTIKNGIIINATGTGVTAAS